MNFDLEFLPRMKLVCLCCRDGLNLRILNLVTQAFKLSKAFHFLPKLVRIVKLFITTFSLCFFLFLLLLNNENEGLEARFLNLTNFGQTVHRNFVPFTTGDKEFRQSLEDELLQE